MKYVYFEASSGASGDMILGALLDLGIPHEDFRKKMSELDLPVDIKTRDVMRAGLRGLRVEVKGKNRPSPARKWADVSSFVKKTPFSSGVKQNALEIFRRLFGAEARVHKTPVEEVYLHEAGADDALVDILGTCWLAEELEIRVFYSSPLNLGRGWTRSAHGMLPVPPPAVGELLRNIPVYSAHADSELVTPTGAAILSTLVKAFCPFPEVRYAHVGYGAGAKNFRSLPNVLRAFYGDVVDFAQEKNVFQVETNIDDATPQLLAHVLDRTMKSGALDAFMTPVVMKKNRLGTKLTLLAEADKIERLIAEVFRETSAIGLRYFPVHRRVLKRETRKVQVLGSEIPIKVAYMDESEVNRMPEFSICQKVAKKTGRPVKEIIQLALDADEKLRT